MTHLDVGTVQALLHQELGESVRDLAERHLTSCDTCRKLVEDARAEDAWVLGRLAVLDESVRHAVVPEWRPRRQSTWFAPGWRRAAGILALLGGSGVLLAMPAVRSWVRQVVGSASLEDHTIRRPATPEDSVAVPTTPSGVAIVPGPRFVIEVEGQRLRLRVVDRPEVSVTASGGRVAFESEEARVVARPDTDVEVTIEVPRDARFVEVLMKGRRVFVVRAGELTPVLTPDANGWYVVGGRR